MAKTILSCGIVPFAQSRGEVHVLLLRAYRYWDFPKGEAGPDEAPLDAALREYAEETGWPPPSVARPDSYYETEPYGRGKTARYYVGEVGEAGEVEEADLAPPELPINPALGRPEHHEARWCTVPQARALLNDRVRAALDWAVEARRQVT